MNLSGVSGPRTPSGCNANRTICSPTAKLWPALASFELGLSRRKGDNEHNDQTSSISHMKWPATSPLSSTTWVKGSRKTITATQDAGTWCRPEARQELTPGGAALSGFPEAEQGAPPAVVSAGQGLRGLRVVRKEVALLGNASLDR